MRIDKIPGYGLQKIAVWPDIMYSSGVCFMSEYKKKRRWDVKMVQRD